ncbi:hypothetical protein P0E69_09695 [Chimaeribacter arupi]|uniref:Uncharacterized protein n=1 Tax=Nissabacter archeti TaxID=1917880 RepID=A0ABS5JCK7_9GAMM|nr:MULTISPECIES: hypothetical protein [Yersiniaceae]MBS0967682.1 hypothetical protein [Nissabacter archeti]WKZ94115.1 hypothetical protein P0E69_09695 [Chimaeribacter arupi]
MSNLTYDQKQILALRTLAGIMFSSLTEQQKEAISRIVGKSPDALDLQIPTSATLAQAEDVKEIYELMKEIIAGE